MLKVTMEPKVLVGTITCELYEYCLEEFVHAIKSLDYNNYDAIVIDNSKNKKYINKIKALGVDAIHIPYHENVGKRIEDSRNALREYGIKHKYDFILFVEQDVILPIYSLKKLVAEERKVMAGVYFVPVTFVKDGNTVNIITPLLGVADEFETGNQHFMGDAEIEEYIKKKSRVMRVKGCGLGCVLVRRDVFNKVKFRFDTYDDAQNFSRDLGKLKIPMYADTSVVCKHRLLNKPSAVHEAFENYHVREEK